ncbi:MAG: T9SS type A sorting domain-containing protein, partial [Candidatus Pacebacteria bacterium]|nr:T9SS type A sorting domain-containing protein [Candidatus Paceibacterota bacterium]
DIGAFEYGAIPVNSFNSANEFQVRVYPNPANEYVTIDIENIGNLTDYSVIITNILGQDVFQSEINQSIIKLDSRNWGGKGLYFVNIINSHGVTIDRKEIVIQ